MAKMSIELYRGMVKRSRELLTKHKCFMNGTTVSGLKIPVVFYEEIQKERSVLNRYIGELDIAIKTLPWKSSGEYRYVSQELKQVDMELMKLEMAFLGKDINRI